jgi:hypothetical protein
MVRPLLVSLFGTLMLFAQLTFAQTHQRTKPNATAQPKTLISQEVQDRLVTREKDLAGAEQRHNIAVIEEALAEDFHELATDGRLYSKSDIMPMLKDITIEDFDLSDFKVFPIDADSVVITYVSTVKGNYKGQPFPPRNAISSVWVRRHGSWKIVFHQATPVPEQK